MFFLQPKSSKINPHTISQATGQTSAWRPSWTTLNFASRVPGHPSVLKHADFRAILFPGHMQERYRELGEESGKRWTPAVPPARLVRTAWAAKSSDFGANLSGAATCRFLPRYLPVTFRIRPGNRIARKSSPFHTHLPGTPLPHTAYTKA